MKRENRSRPMSDDWLRAQAAAVTHPVATGLAKLNIHPNTITIVGFVFNVVAGVIVGLGQPRIGGVVMLVASATDAFDGALARISGTQSRFGAFLDSTLDRFSEGAVLIGMLAWMLNRGDVFGVLATALTLLGSVMVSYTRARAEGVGYACKVGLLTRPMRVLLLGVALVTLWTQPILILLVALTWFTVMQRLVHVYRVSRLDP